VGTLHCIIIWRLWFSNMPVCAQATTQMTGTLHEPNMPCLILTPQEPKTLAKSPLCLKITRRSHGRKENWKVAKNSFTKYGLWSPTGFYYKVIEAPFCQRVKAKGGCDEVRGAWESVRGPVRLHISEFWSYRTLQLREIWPPLWKSCFCRSIVKFSLSTRSRQSADPQGRILSSLARLLQLTSDFPISFPILNHLAFSSFTNNSSNFLSCTKLMLPQANFNYLVRGKSFNHWAETWVSFTYPVCSDSGIMLLRNLTKCLELFQVWRQYAQLNLSTSLSLMIFFASSTVHVISALGFCNQSHEHTLEGTTMSMA